MGEKLTRTQQKNLERLGGVNPADESFSRRQFLMQAGGTGLVVGGAVAAGALLHDRWGMEGIEPPPRVGLRDYSVALPASRPNVVVVRANPPRGEGGRDFASKEEELQAREQQA